MKLALVTDAWQPQINGVVTTLVELVRELQAQGHTVEVIHPGLFKTRPCPGYAGIDLAVSPGKKVAELLQAAAPDAIHLATEGPLGWAARRYCLRHRLAFTTAYHTRFPELLHAAIKVPLWMTYALFRHFHRPSSGVLVPTQAVLRLLDSQRFRNLRSWTHGVDMELFTYQPTRQFYEPLGTLARPVSLFVGRVSYEKNIEAFLRLDVPGSKIVCGVGPLESQLQARFPQVKWLGVLPRDELAKVYAAADVFVMPSRSETFGLVMLEAMACGTPVAAYPVDGPTEVVGVPAHGGALDADLGSAWYQALAVPRHEARGRALQFSWAYASRLFVGHLVPARRGFNLDKNDMTTGAVTELSSNA
jgi:glycosyltransferase involved in cell wall biosynthesis